MNSVGVKAKDPYRMEANLLGFDLISKIRFHFMSSFCRRMHEMAQRKHVNVTYLNKTFRTNFEKFRLLFGLIPLLKASNRFKSHSPLHCVYGRKCKSDDWRAHWQFYS